MATLKEFEDALRQHGMTNALAILDQLKKRDRENRSIAPARRVVGRKMTAELARTVLEMHASTGMTQQEIAFKLGVNQGRVNEVIKRGKWLNSDPAAPEALSRDKAMERLAQRAKARRTPQPDTLRPVAPVAPAPVVQQSGVVPGTERAPVAHRRQPAVMAPTTVPPDLNELPLEEPVRVKVNRAEPAVAKVAPRRPAEPTTSPIVSAQLAFLDL